MRILPWLLRRLVTFGTVTLIGPDGRTRTFGGDGPGPDLTVRVTDPGLDWKLLRGPRLAIAEAYMDGGLEFEQGGLRDLMQLYQVNKKTRRRSAAESGWRSLLRMTRRFIARNDPIRSRRNARAHYDIGNDLYRLFLDDDMQYSCAYFPKLDETLDEAQLAKRRHIAAKLLPRSGQRVLDIGSGWGGMALYLAQVADVEVLGVTLSEEQLKIARERAAAAGLSDRVRFELQDYRNVTGQFDRIVSVGMMEHVGATELRTFFATVRDRLAPDGVALIHSIMTSKSASLTDPFTQKYIFPGGYVPGASETLAAVERAGLWILDFEVWRKHYGFTLNHWYNRFIANREAAKAMYDERFCRMWELYLLGCESAFLTGNLAVMQLQLGRERDAVPLVRDYMAEETERLKQRESAPGLERSAAPTGIPPDRAPPDKA
jgi:cyclopropane-fatty-acyl-phospholipid synthase